MKVARTVLSGGKDGDNFKVLPIATNKNRKMRGSQRKRTLYIKGSSGDLIYQLHSW